MPVFDDHTMIQTEESFDDVYISDITKRHISVGREPALIDNEIFHFLIQVYRFYHLEGIGCIQYALYHAHDDDSHKDADDGYWQFLCGKNHNIEDSRVISLQQIYEFDKSIKEIANLEYGKIAYRKDKNSKWNIQ